MDIPAALFKAECLQLMDRVEKSREPITITKHGRPVAQLTPIPAGTDSLFGYMSNTTKIAGDIQRPSGIEWSALSGDEDHLYSRVRAKKPGRKK